MIESGLKRAATISFALHMAFIILTFFSIGRRATFVIPPPYVVSLVSPSENQGKTSRVPPAKKEIPAAKEVPPAKKETTAEPKGVRTVEKAPPKPKEDLTKYSEEKIAALKAQKEREEYLADRKSALEAKQKLARVKELGQVKSAVSVTARPAQGVTGPETGDPSLAGDYINSVRTLIEQEWVLPEALGKDLQAIITVKILKNGGLKIIGFERTSGDAIFDNAAVKAINKANPVPPPPYEMELGIRFSPVYD